jgi:hypothetical protein
MHQEIVVQPQPRTWLENSILQPYVSRYGEHLSRRRVCPKHPARLFVLRRALRPLADRGTVHAKRVGQGSRRPLLVGACSGVHMFLSGPPAAP